MLQNTLLQETKVHPQQIFKMEYLNDASPCVIKELRSHLRTPYHVSRYNVTDSHKTYLVCPNNATRTHHSKDRTIFEKIQCAFRKRTYKRFAKETFLLREFLDHKQSGRRNAVFKTLLENELFMLRRMFEMTIFCEQLVVF